MKNRIWILRSAATLVIYVSVVSCVGLGGLGGGADTALCPELGGGALRGNFSSEAKANATMRAFVQASSDLAKLAERVDGEVAGACERMGRDLGLSAAEMGKSTEAKCAAVSSKID